MPDRVTLFINGKPISVPVGSIVAAAVARSYPSCFHHSVHQETRSPLCGMGACFECCVTINGSPHRRSCLTLCEEGMEVLTGA
jgi:sarcosine oxidase subunit alpha